MPASDGSAPDAGEIIWVNFGSPVGHEQAGRRPALVLSSREYNATSSVWIVCPITQTARKWPFSIAFASVGGISGHVLVDQIKVIDPAVRAIRRAGHVSEQTLGEVRGRLAVLLGIPVSR